MAVPRVNPDKSWSNYSTINNTPAIRALKAATKPIIQASAIAKPLLGCHQVRKR